VFNRDLFLVSLVHYLHLTDIIHIVQTGVRQHQYVDDIQIYMAIFNTTTSADLSILESSFSILSTWFSHNWLAVNPENSDSLLLGTYQCNHTLSNSYTVHVLGSAIQLADYIKLLGIPLYIPLSFHKHVSLVSQSCFIHFKALWHNRPCLDTQTAYTIAHTLVNSQLDYANSVLNGELDSVILTFQ